MTAATTTTGINSSSNRRADKALDLMKGVVRNPDDGSSFSVHSQTSDKAYQVSILGGNIFVCTCPDFEYRGNVCKHIHAVKLSIEEGKAAETNNDDDQIHKLAADLASIAEDYFAVYGDGSTVPLRQDEEAQKLRAGRSAIDHCTVREVRHKG